jgi:hypothetical protein
MAFRVRFMSPALAILVLGGTLGLGIRTQSWGTSATDAPPPPVSTPIAAGRVAVMPVATLEGGPPGVAAAVYKVEGQIIVLSNVGVSMQPDVSPDTPTTGATTTEPPTVLSR